MLVEKLDRIAARGHGEAGFFPLRSSCDECRIRLLREKFQRNRSRMLEYAPLKPQKIGQQSCVFSHLPQLFRSGIAVPAKRGEVIDVCHENLSPFIV
ncbi:MAG: hypothetical protein IKI45_12080 [Oscillospiraceae bacterium]|nr:hypothetical protein [Oscillospiraceae bacterium]